MAHERLLTRVRSVSVSLGAPGWTGVLVRHGLFALLVVVLAVILKPDLYGLIPNSLDPIFYTGYATNLDDALAAAGNRHYFVTRWSSYLPQYLSCSVFGPYWGRLVLRLLLLSVIFEMFWRVGSRFKFTPASRVAASLLVVFSPIFIRAFTTDYQEYSTTFYGLCLTVIVISQSMDWRRGLLAGVLSAAMIISNPFTLGLVAASLVVWFLAEFRGARATRIFLFFVSFGIGFLVTVVFGYLLFRYHFRIGNVYEPTIRFIRDFKPPQPDPWTAPGKGWLGHFGWLYMPPIVLVLAHAAFRGSEPVVKKTVRSLMTLVVLVYGFHVYMQIRNGHALETGFYWAMALPPLYALVFLLLGKMAPKRFPAVHMLFLAVLLVCLIHFETPQKLSFGAGKALYAGLFIASLVVYVMARFRSQIGWFTLAVFLLWIQLGSPEYSTLTYGGDLNSPRYDLTFGQQAELSNSILQEVIWFNNQMDRITDDSGSTFMSAGGWSSAIIATYIPHPLGRWIVAESEIRPLRSNVVYDLEFGTRKYLAVFGDVNEVRKLIPGVTSQLKSSDIVLDTTHAGGLGYRLVVFAGNSGPTASAELSPADLGRTVGTLNEDGDIEVSVGSGNGYATSGPYLYLTEGQYRLRLEFASDEVGILGKFEAYRDNTGTSFGTQLVSDGSGEQWAEVLFDVGKSDGTWQFRTEYFGSIKMRIERILLHRMAEP